MTAFADSSAIVKLYADEAGAASIRALPFLVVSALARVEVPAALWHKSRMGELSAEHAIVLAAAYEADWHSSSGPFVAVALRPRLLDEAAQLVATHGLRASDAVQLCCALKARAADPQVDTFACFDAELRDAAAKEGFTLIG